MSRGLKVPGVSYVPPAEADAYRATGAWIWSTLGDELRAAAREAGDKTYIIGDSESLTFSDLDARSESVAACLLDAGLQPGDRALFQVGSTPELVTALFGCLKAGIIPVCTLAQYRDIEMGQLASQSGARAFFVQADVSSNFDQLGFARQIAAKYPSIQQIIVLRGEAGPGEHDLADMARRHDRQTAHRRVSAISIHPEDVAFFQLSGGSTGVPKIIPRMHAEYLGQSASWKARHEITAKDIGLWSLPLIHNAGMVLMMVPFLLARATFVLQSRFEIGAFLEAIQKHRVTYTGSIGPVAPRIIEYANIAAFDLSSWRMAFTLSRADGLEEHIGIPSQNMYGITEGVLMGCRPGEARALRHGTLGSPTGIGEDMKLLDPAGQEVGDGVPGELCFKGPHVLRGYYDAPEINAASFTSDGYFRTGDIVRSETHDGVRFFVFEGRLKDNINRGGEKFGAEEVETLIGRHPSVADARVVAMPCPFYGERACAFLVLRPGSAAPSVDDLGQFLRGLGLAKFKCPERVEVIDAFPVTRVGKVDKAAMRQQIAAMVAAEAAADKAKSA